MNPPLSFSDALTQLNLYTSQTANFTFTPDEVTQALQTAWNDTFVCDQALDSSTTFVVGTFSYPIPTALTTVREIYFQRSTADAPERISPDLYEVIAGNVQFLRPVTQWLGTTYTLQMKGLYKLTTDDELDTQNLVNYVISLAAEILLTNLVLKAAFVFLRNDISVPDITRALQIIQGNTLRYKQALLREFESS